MANINMLVYQAGRAAASSANYTDNKTAAVTGNTYYIPNNSHVGLIAECTAGGTATIVTTGSIDSLSVTDLTITTTAAKVQIWGAFPGGIYNDGSGNMAVTVSANTNLFAFRLA